ncbi:Fe(3+) dicitrate ABC transporter substrate-binding protein [Leucothrix arctica]|uniref:Fe(3+)-dicitrate ABC transporter substrate-binding protein FecB n=1 Tax=Leucothrix arctica TaxID=1481894 RepID=A0A317C918_9GAMM|nr:Fe(3+) dicitrate ABC transporter substrate-binding protein [Leucothrix arctica]PWQ95175.1 Fe(3+)-dicitrate ABC transporter substrate-binding protein FecB [Leucothrix arctica]
MLRSLKLLGLSLLIVALPALASAVDVEDEKGTFSIEYTPKRIVVLEFSFADALAAVGISPVGIADDKEKARVLPAVREVIGDWESVGMRSQPSLEVIASLKPDLIIADIGRHEAVYEDLKKIAPTLILRSRRETYEDNLKASAIIGKVVGKHEAMQARLTQHREFMQSYKEKLPKGGSFQFGVARHDLLSLHPEAAYAGGVIKALGLENAKTGAKDGASRRVSLEQLLAVNPDYLIIGEYSKPNVLNDWEKEPLWNVLKAVKNNRIFNVDPNTWSRCRGIMAAEQMAKDLVKILTP